MFLVAIEDNNYQNPPLSLPNHIQWDEKQTTGIAAAINMPTTHSVFRR